MTPSKDREGIGDGAAAPRPGLAVAAREPAVPPESLISGRAMLLGGREFPCTAHGVTVTTAEIVAEIKAEAGQLVICYLDGIGLMPGKVARATRKGFTMALHLPEAQRERMAGRLEWHSNRAARSAELRAAPRIVPIHTTVEVRLGEAIVLPGRILNVSMSGAAIALDAQAIPFVGARVRVGGRFANVVRLLATGIAVQFDEPFMPNHFDERVRL